MTIFVDSDGIILMAVMHISNLSGKSKHCVQNVRGKCLDDLLPSGAVVEDGLEVGGDRVDEVDGEFM